MRKQDRKMTQEDCYRLCPFRRVMERAYNITARKEEREAAIRKTCRRSLFLFILLEIAQWATAGVVIAGLVLELRLKADWCFIFVTAGAILWAIVQKIRHPHYKKRS